MIFDPLTVASLLVLAASQPQSASALCAMPKPTEIKVSPTTRKVAFDYTKSLSDLQGVSIDTIDPHSFNGVSVTQGFMKGAIRLVPEVRLGNKTYPSYNAGCVWYDSVVIKIEIDPTIVIAKEVKSDKCMSKAVAEHEMKHVMVDRRIVNKYSQIMGKEVYDALAQRGFTAGPMPISAMQSVAERMQKTVLQVVEHEYKKMDLEREELQGGVDNINEYTRVKNLCPDFNPAVSGRR